LFGDGVRLVEYPPVTGKVRVQLPLFPLVLRVGVSGSTAVSYADRKSSILLLAIFIIVRTNVFYKNKNIFIFNRWLLLYDMQNNKKTSSSRRTQQDIDNMINLYESGMSYRDIQIETGWGMMTIIKTLKGSRTLSQAAVLARKQGKGKLTEEGRLALSNAGKKAVCSRGKCWTAPERKFKTILNEIGIGVKFPDYVKELFNLKDDERPEICFQYPLQRYVCDFVDVDRKIVYAVNGDFWHANPLLYDKEKLTSIQKHNITQDNNRKIFLEKKGFFICVIWESEINWNQELVKNKIWATRKTAIRLPYMQETTAFDSLVAHSSDWSKKIQELWFKKPKQHKKLELSEKCCEQCNVKFTYRKTTNNDRKFCSPQCYSFSKRLVQRPSYKDLINDLSHMSKVSMGKKYGVSDKAVAKWIKQYENCLSV